jgi:hypothetical protein
MTAAYVRASTSSAFFQRDDCAQPNDAFCSDCHWNPYHNLHRDERVTSADHINLLSCSIPSLMRQTNRSIVGFLLGASGELRICRPKMPETAKAPGRASPSSLPGCQHRQLHWHRCRSTWRFRLPKTVACWPVPLSGLVLRWPSRACIQFRIILFGSLVFL